MPNICETFHIFHEHFPYYISRFPYHNHYISDLILPSPATRIAPYNPPHTLGTAPKHAVLLNGLARVLRTTWAEFAVSAGKKRPKPPVIGGKGFLVKPNKAQERRTEKLQ